MGDPWCSHDAMGYHRAGFDVVGVDGAGRVRGWGRLGQSDRWWIFLAAMLALTTGATAGYALLRPRSVVSTVALPPVTSFPPVPQDVVLPPPARALVRPAVFPVPATTSGSCAGAACDRHDGPRRRGPQPCRRGVFGPCAVRGGARVPAARPGFTAREAQRPCPQRPLPSQRPPQPRTAPRGVTRHPACPRRSRARQRPAQRRPPPPPPPPVTHPVTIPRHRRPARIRRPSHVAVPPRHNRADLARARHHPSPGPDMNEPAAHATMFHFVKQPRYYASVDDHP